MPTPRRITVLLLPLAVGLAGSAAAGQPPALADSRRVPLAIGSGVVRNDRDAPAVIFATDVVVPEARWLRLSFGRGSLGPGPAGGPGTIVQITSLLDGATQRLSASSLAEWRFTSAYFNGPAVRVELHAPAGAPPSEILIDEAMTGAAPDGDGGGGGGDGGGVANLCGEDDRVPSDDPRACRLLPATCSAWMIEDCRHCFLTAGHCFDSVSEVIVAEFNVPPSDPVGWSRHPPPEFQFAIDPHSVQYRNDGLGKDWAYFGCFPNSTTGLTAYETQGAAFVLAAAPPPVEGQQIRVTGYGTDYSPGPERNRTQQTHAGTYVGSTTLTVRYVVDTTTGSSGSPVIDDSTGLAVGVHTSGACNVFGYNLGTAIHNPELAAALAAPRGICAPPPLWAFEFPDGLPDLLEPDGDSIRVQVSGDGDDGPVPGTGMLHFEAGPLVETIPMVQVRPNVYDAAFPPLPCGVEVSYYLSAETAGGETITFPRYALTERAHATAAYGTDAAFIDHFESDTGWSVESSPELTGGAWERGRPDGYGLRGDPAFDGDGSGLCYLTENFTGDSDVDAGSTTLTSPVLDATDAPDPTITYRRWFTNAFGGGAPDDRLIVEISDDSGSTWFELETVGPDGPDAAGGWVRREFALADVPGLAVTDELRLRFVVSDTGAQRVVEAAIDDVRLNRVPGGLLCAAACIADCAPEAGDGVVDSLDLWLLVSQWGRPGGPCDLSDDGTVDVIDLLLLLSSWGACP